MTTPFEPTAEPSEIIADTGIKQPQMPTSLIGWYKDLQSASEAKLAASEAQNRKMEEFLLKGSRTKIKTGDIEEEIVIFSAQDMDTLTLYPMKNEAKASEDMQKLLEEWECLDSTYKWNGTDYHGGWSETWEKKAVPILCHIHTLESQNKLLKDCLKDYVESCEALGHKPHCYCLPAIVALSLLP